MFIRMFWRLVGFGVLYYLVLMLMAAIAQLRQWRFIRLICLYALSMGLGVIFAALLSILLRYWLPKFSLIVFLVLSLWWSWLGWRHASSGVRL